MDRAEATGLGVATAAHVALFAALSLGLAITRLPPPAAPPIQVSFVKDVGLDNAAPQPTPSPPAPSAAPEVGPPEEAASEPAPLAPPPPLPKVAPPTPTPPKAVEAPRPKPAPQPVAKPAPAKAAKPAPPQPAAAPASAKPTPQHAPGHAGSATATRGSRLSFDFLKGVGSDPTPSKAQQAPASVMSAEALAGITSAIRRQVQPCANRQVDPGPGANQIKVTLNLRLNRDGSLARTPTVVRTAGVNDENSRYEDRVRDLAIAAYVGCAPLHDLPDDLYQTPKGGWGNINMTYNLP